MQQLASGGSHQIVGLCKQLEPWRELRPVSSKQQELGGSIVWPSCWPRLLACLFVVVTWSSAHLVVAYLLWSLWYWLTCGHFGIGCLAWFGNRVACLLKGLLTC